MGTVNTADTRTFLVIDFETLTPKGRRPEPIEVAAAEVEVSLAGHLREIRKFQSLIRPPADVPVTAFDIAQTGITQADLDTARDAAHVLAELDRLVRSGPPRRLIAHNAAHEAGLIADQRPHCPSLAATPLLDTVRLARAAYPGLTSYRLDAVLRHQGIPIPPDRHRAMPDVELTARLFARILGDGAGSSRWTTWQEIDAAAYVSPTRTAPGHELVQESLFG